MSSSLYARYIPPKKTVTVEPIVTPITVPSPAKPTPQPLQAHTPQPFIHPSRANLNIAPPQQPNKASKRKHENSTAAQDGPLASSKKAKKSSNAINTAKPPQRPPPPIQQVPTSQYESKDEKRAAKLARRAHQRALEQGLEVEDKPTYQTPVKAVEKIIPEVQPKEKKIPKRPKKKAENADDARSKQEAEEDAKHKSVLAKRAKSLKKGEKIVRKERERALERGEDVEMKDAEALPEEPVELHALEPLPQPEPLPEAKPISIYSALPSWLGSPTRVAPTATASFEDLGLSKVIIEPLKKAGFENAFAVQAAVLPLLLPGPLHQPGDVLVSAATGSGKTLSYVLPMVNDISQTTVTQLRGLIVMPTRELVSQAREVCDICANAYTTGSRRHVNVGVAIGNQTLKQEQASLMKQEYVYNPKEYGARQKRINAMWSASAIETDANPNLMEEEDDLAPLDHLIKSSPKVDILICTPGRLVEHLKTTPGFTLDHLKWLVIDEADKLLDQSFQQWLETVMASLSSREVVAASQQQSKSGVTKVVLSATMTRDIGLLTQLKLNKPKFVVLEGSEEDAETGQKRTETLNLPASLHESAVKVDDEGLKPLYLLEVLKRNGLLTPTSSIKDATDYSSSSSSSDSDSSEDDSSDDDTSSDGSSSEESSDADSSSDDSSDDDSSSSSDASSTSSASSKTTSIKEPTITASLSSPRGALIFTKSNESAVRLSRLLALLSPSHASLIGTVTSTTSRKRTLRSFRTGKLSILIASDLVARGIDLPNLAHVVNYDMPSSLTSYVHRVGRTARAGKEGAATTLFTAAEGRWFWNDIARNGLQRKEKVERITISAKDVFTKDDKERYESALEQLGKEASGSGEKR